MENMNEETEEILKVEKPYENIYTLDFVFVGHTNDIVDLFFQEERNYLYSSSKDQSIKVWDFAVTHYLFNIIFYSFRKDIRFSTLMLI